MLEAVRIIFFKFLLAGGISLFMLQLSWFLVFEIIRKIRTLLLIFCLLGIIVFQVKFTNTPVQPQQSPQSQYTPPILDQTLITKNMSPDDAKRLLTNYENMIKTGPASRDTYLNAALLADQLHDTKRAQTYLKKAVELDPNHPYFAKKNNTSYTY